MRDQGKSKILFLIICSNRKAPGGAGPYDATGAVHGCVPSSEADLLFEGRSKVYDLLATGEAERHGLTTTEYPYARGLVRGPEFGPTGTDDSGLYRPAAERYIGRYYGSLKEQDYEHLLSSPHHVLIVSGLYGLLTPSEMIQLYSCHVTDHEAIPRVWQQGDRLTEILLAYARRHGIAKIFSLIADPHYRRLLAWTTIRHTLKHPVLHCFSDEFAGPEALPSLGVLSRQLLHEPERILLALPAGHRRYIESDGSNILFETSQLPPRGTPQEIEQARRSQSVADQIGRIRRNYIRIMDSVGQFTQQRLGFGQRIQILAKRPGLNTDQVAQLRRFGRLRNEVEYGDFKLSEQDLQELKDEYAAFATWAEKHHRDAVTGKELEHLL